MNMTKLPPCIMQGDSYLKTQKLIVVDKAENKFIKKNASSSQILRGSEIWDQCQISRNGTLNYFPKSKETNISVPLLGL